MGITNARKSGTENPGCLFNDDAVFLGAVENRAVGFNKTYDFIRNMVPGIESLIAFHVPEGKAVFNVPGRISQSIVNLSISVSILEIDGFIKPVAMRLYLQIPIPALKHLSFLVIAIFRNLEWKVCSGSG
jgi:hypothetical protein